MAKLLDKIRGKATKVGSGAPDVDIAQSRKIPELREKDIVSLQ